MVAFANAELSTRRSDTAPSEFSRSRNAVTSEIVRALGAEESSEITATESRRASVEPWTLVENSFRTVLVVDRWTQASISTATTTSTDLPVRPNAGTNDSYVPRTALGKRLWELRQRIVRDGTRLLNWDEIEQEKAERRGKTV